VPAIHAGAGTICEPWGLRRYPVMSGGIRDNRNFPSGCHLQPRDLRNTHGACSADRNLGESLSGYRAIVPNIESSSVKETRLVTRRDDARHTNADLLGQIGDETGATVTLPRVQHEHATPGAVTR
jgi:hypothetical protein